MSESKPVISVVAGALMRADGSFMLGSRPAGKPYAGYWEFPGGKVEPGETPLAALVREFREEMGIEVSHATPWLTRIHHYEHASVHLRFFRIWAWQGTPQPHEGQSFAWQTPGHHSVTPMLPANDPVLRSLQLPDVLQISCVSECGRDHTLEVLAQRDNPGWVMVREPQKSREQLADFVAEVADIVHPRGGKLLVNTDPAWIRGWPVDGLHLSGQRLAALDERPPHLAWVGASAHSSAELARAAALGLDYALLGHVQPTASHPQQATLGWNGFARLLQNEIPLPVFAIGGLQAADLDTARTHGAHGIALMRGAWR
ncbi:hypothetical protein GCM10011419_18880 [Vogesella fluminis]|uniref:8-oxo-dGTP diphosphatase n=2 Tax=Vogesella fluminis TaxID=1069161 RepID=A0ABQ3HEB4_9NEIS|nr:hypothetical protein GCM10011419_18880 [Vogesella fluminis]